MDAKRVLIVEEVTPGHPDKLADLISDAALDWVLERDPDAVARFDTSIGNLAIVIMANLRSRVSRQKTERALPGLVKQVFREAGYTDGRWGVDPESCPVAVQWVEEDPAAWRDEPGTVFGHAEAGCPDLIPIPVRQAREMAMALYGLRCDGGQTWIGPGCRAELAYAGAPRGPRKLQKVTLHVPLEEGLDPVHVSEMLRFWVMDFNLGDKWKDAGVEFVLSSDKPSGLKDIWNGPGRTNTRCRTLLFGTAGEGGERRLCGFSPVYEYRPMAYLARYIAKNVVAAKLASICTVELGVDSSRADQVFAYLGPLGGRVDEARLVEAIKLTFPLTPRAAEDLFQMRAPIYREVALYGHFGRGLQKMPWEQTDRVDALHRALGL